MVYQGHEKQRLIEYARGQWGIDGHVLPYELVTETLHHSIRSSALQYFEDHLIKWWSSRWDGVRPTTPRLPTGHLNSSQVACVNHLERARRDATVAHEIIDGILPSALAVELDDGYVEYEWIGSGSYLNEPGPRVRGANVTSLDAVMCGERGGNRYLIAIEWKYLERYGRESIATSERGTDRVATYRPLIDHPESPILVGLSEWLFYEPYYQLMRQTLLAWQMVEHREFGASDWIHLHVVPGENQALRLSAGSAPMLIGDTMSDKWRSVLKEPSRYRLLSPTELLANVAITPELQEWRVWLRNRYLT